MSTFSTNLALELIGNGEQAGNWGQTTNTNLGTLVEQAISGYTTLAMADSDQTLAMTQGASATARNMYIELTGALTAARNVIVPGTSPNANKKLYFIFNNTTGGYAVTVKVAGQTGVSVPNNTKTILVCNGTDIVLATTAAATGVTQVNTGSNNINGISLTGGPITSTGTISLTGSLSNVNLASQITGTLPVANGGTGSTSGVPASIVQAGTFSSGTYVLNSSSLLRLGASSPTANWRLYAIPVNQGTGHPAIVSDRQNYADSSCFFCDDTTSGSASRNMIVFGLNNTGYAAISTNGTTITYGTGSDYRLKNNVTPLTDSATKVKALKPCSYNWVNAPDIQGQGFLAHELAEVVPQAVVGAKDAVNADGSIKSQQVDLSYVIPLLTAALQEALVRIEALEAKVG